MLLKKKSETYNTYVLEVSWGDLMAFKAALEANHDDPVRDEKMAELNWYLANIPGPGEDPDADADAKTVDGVTVPGEQEDDGMPLPVPPGQQKGAEPGFPPPFDKKKQPPGGPGAKTGAAPAPMPEEGMEDTMPAPSDAPKPGGKAQQGKLDNRIPEPPSE